MICPNDDLGKACEPCICKYRVIAVIPCFGRFKLLQRTLERLYSVNGITKVVMVGHEPEVKEIAHKTNSHYVHHKNEPLGLKWNAGFLAARELKADAVLFVGSSDWIDAEWLPEALRYLPEYDMIGRLDCYLLDINTISKIKRLVHWPGYGHGVRSEEPIGIGRVISARVLDKIHWRPFNDHKDNSMDWFMYDAVLQNSGKIKLMDKGKSMAISTNLWPNKHQFESHWKGRELPSHKIQGPDMNDFLEKNFPDALTVL